MPPVPMRGLRDATAFAESVPGQLCVSRLLSSDPGNRQPFLTCIIMRDIRELLVSSLRVLRDDAVVCTLCRCGIDLSRHFLSERTLPTNRRPRCPPLPPVHES